jgi:hypothetical protein
MVNGNSNEKESKAVEASSCTHQGWSEGWPCWSMERRKAQLAVSAYKKAGGSYAGSKKQTDLSKWTKQNWRTKSGKPSSETGERYLPEKAIKSLSSSEYAATTRAKREGTKEGKQFVAQPKSIAKKVAKYRK